MHVDLRLCLTPNAVVVFLVPTRERFFLRVGTNLSAISAEQREVLGFGEVLLGATIDAQWL